MAAGDTTISSTVERPINIELPGLRMHLRASGFSSKVSKYEGIHHLAGDVVQECGEAAALVTCSYQRPRPAVSLQRRRTCNLQLILSPPPISAPFLSAPSLHHTHHSDYQKINLSTCASHLLDRVILSSHLLHHPPCEGPPPPDQSCSVFGAAGPGPADALNGLWAGAVASGLAP
jgi:hypothetical protein